MVREVIVDLFHCRLSVVDPFCERRELFLQLIVFFFGLVTIFSSGGYFVQSVTNCLESLL